MEPFGINVVSEMKTSEVSSTSTPSSELDQRLNRDCKKTNASSAMTFCYAKSAPVKKEITTRKLTYKSLIGKSGKKWVVTNRRLFWPVNRIRTALILFYSNEKRDLSGPATEFNIKVRKKWKELLGSILMS